jgi:hypothetical protein
VHTLYDNRREPDVVRPGEGRNSRMLAKAATITFWIPLLSADILIVARSGLRPDGFARAADLLFRETVIYLGFWMMVAVIQGVLFSRSVHRSHRKRTAAKQESSKLGNAALNRERAGL